MKELTHTEAQNIANVAQIIGGLGRQLRDRDDHHGTLQAMVTQVSYLLRIVEPLTVEKAPEIKVARIRLNESPAPRTAKDVVLEQIKSAPVTTSQELYDRFVVPGEMSQEELFSSLKQLHLDGAVRREGRNYSIETRMGV